MVHDVIVIYRTPRRTNWRRSRALVRQKYTRYGSLVSPLDPARHIIVVFNNYLRDVRELSVSHLRTWRQCSLANSVRKVHKFATFFCRLHLPIQPYTYITRNVFSTHTRDMDKRWSRNPNRVWMEEKEWGLSTHVKSKRLQTRHPPLPMMPIDNYMPHSQSQPQCRPALDFSLILGASCGGWWRWRDILHSTEVLQKTCILVVQLFRPISARVRCVLKTT